jgi:hypothetical protein
LALKLPRFHGKMASEHADGNNVCANLYIIVSSWLDGSKCTKYNKLQAMKPFIQSLEEG